jgi:hypothetical protein
VKDNLKDLEKVADSPKEKVTAKANSIKEAAQKAAQAAQKLMSDKPPAPIELGGVADRLPQKGGSVVITPPALPALPPGVQIPKGQ